MLYTVKIKLTTPMLGAQRTNRRIRMFRRGKGDYTMEFDPRPWLDAMEEAADDLGVAFDSESVRFPLEMRMPSLHLFSRKYFHRGKLRQEDHEEMRSGAVLTFPLLVMSRPQRNRHPSESDSRAAPLKREDLEKILTFVGLHVGVSPWGSKHSYGRFELIGLETEKPEAAPGLDGFHRDDLRSPDETEEPSDIHREDPGEEGMADGEPED